MSGIPQAVYASVFVHGLDAVLLAHPDGAVFAANAAACRLLGRTEEEICALGRRGVVDPGFETLPAERADSGTQRAELLFVHRDGTRIPVEVGSTAFTDDTGEAWTVIVAHDLRTRKQVEDDLKSSQLLLETIVDSTPDFIWSVNPDDFGIVWFNRAFETYFARERGMQVAFGQRPADLFDDPAWVRFWEDLYRRTRAEGTVEVEYQVSAGTHVLGLTLTAMSSDGVITGISAFGRDITEQQRSRRQLEESEARSRTIVDTLTEGVVFQAADGTILSVNPAAERIEGRGEEDMLGKNSEDPEWGAVRADGTPFPGSEHPSMVTLRTGEQQRDVVMGILTPGGERRWISINSAPVFGDGPGEPTAVVTTFHDITQQKRSEDELRVAAIAFEESQEAMLIAAPDTTILRVNKAFTEVTGYSAAEAVGQTPRLLSSGRQGPPFYREMWDALTVAHRWQGEIWNRRRNGDVYPEWLRISAVADTAGRVTHYVGTFTDLSETKKAEQDIVTLAFHDTLTGLPNRRLLLDRLGQSVLGTARRRRRGSLLFVDLDGFTLLNETRGHAAGDFLLKEVASRLQAHVHAEDTVARVGSDEFAVMLDSLDRDPERAARQADGIAQRLRAALSEPLDIDGREYRCRASIGVSMFGEGKPDPQELLKHADVALMQAKQDGRDVVRFFNHEIQAALEKHVEFGSALRTAIPDELRLVYQPQVDGRGDIVGAEALVRWHHPNLGNITPATFIPVAEENGLILPIGQWVLDTACRQIKSWESDPSTRHLVLSVNVSARQFHQPDFVDTVLGALSESGADPSRLTLELTESLLVHDLVTVAEHMSRLRSHGVDFSLDDFGTGYSSLRSLKSLPLHELKIDQSFVQDVSSDDNSSAIVRTIIALGQSLGLTVIAEGVETKEHLRVLTMLGCNRFQGYLFGRPMDTDDFSALIRSRHPAQ